MENIKALTRAVEAERGRYHSSGDYSVTDLINPPRVVALRKRYGDQTDQPLSAVIPSLIGTFIHEGFELYLRKWAEDNDYKDYQFERELMAEINGRKISGRFDLMDGLDIYDFKSCKVWKKIFDPDLEEWHQQQNLYAYLLHLNGVDVNSINIIAIYKDWQENMSLRDRNYPQDQICEYKLELWPWEKTEAFLNERLDLHMACEGVDDGDLPQCTREERWERFSGGHTVEYAIMKTRSAKRATKVIRTCLDDAYIAAKKIKGISNESVIEIRYSKRLRCEKYCAVNKFCNHFKIYSESMASGTLNDYLPVYR